MQEAFVNISDIPTHIMTWGNWIEESFTKKEVVICITGNPGLPGFYTKFMSTIHETIGQDIPVWVIGHVGHDEPPSTSLRKVPNLIGNESKFGLDAQIRHKVEFIQTYVPDDVKIHLIGHSIGSWMILELLKIPEIKNKIQHCYLLFPTIERMAISRNGFIFTKCIQPMWFIFRLFYILFSKLPLVVQALFISFYFFIFSIPRHYVGTALKYARLSITEKVLLLADEEMKQVVDIDLVTIQNNKHLLKMYYGATDGWTPKKYYYQLKDKIPDLDVEMDVKNISHAFVLHSSYEMGRIVGEWILFFRRI